ncbi:MAG: hypothetical protein JOZ33_14800 [Acidobacteriaceae bacterium]|nr:hypothetical protein [Acidobacteriaceae bacterium]
MSSRPMMKPVGDTVSKLNNEIAVGEDLDFQRKWWKFERAAWAVLVSILIIDLAGGLGRGPLAKAKERSPDGSIQIEYERLQRMGSPSIVTITFQPSVVKTGTVTLFVTNSLVKKLGAQRVIPEPQSTVVGNGGLTYNFPVTGMPGSIEFDLQPTSIGLHHLLVQVAGAAPVRLNIFVFP